MIPVIHRVNTLDELAHVPSKYGVEFDIRAYGDGFTLHHEPFVQGEDIEPYLAVLGYKKQALAIFDVKCEWMGQRLLQLINKYHIENYFLLGINPPEMIALTNAGVRNIAVRMSEYEPLSAALSVASRVNWLWIDVFTKFPVNKKDYEQILAAGLKTCLVCPERWGRPTDIAVYKKIIKQNKIQIDAVMTSRHFVKQWAGANA